MYVVIFRATVRALDADYLATAQRLRALAHEEFGCLAFHALTEGDQEIALSYWPDLASIRAWREHPEHRAAQARGLAQWYREVHVEVAEVQRAYARP